jgi:hypothetical protein
MEIHQTQNSTLERRGPYYAIRIAAPSLSEQDSEKQPKRIGNLPPVRDRGSQHIQGH